MKLKDVTSVITDFVANGSFASLKKNARYVDFDEAYARVIRLTDANSNYNLANAIYVDESSYNFLSKSSLTPNDLIISNVGANLGTAFLCPKLNIPMTLGPNAILIKPNHKALSRYLYYYFSSVKGYNSLISLSSGSAMPKFNKTDIRNLSVSIHDLSEQQHIVNTIGSIDELIENYKSQENAIIDLLRKKISQFPLKTSLGDYTIEIVGSGIPRFDFYKEYLDTSSIEGVNRIVGGGQITYNERPSRANMKPYRNSVWFAKMKNSNKILLISELDNDIISNNILSTGYVGIRATENLPISLLFSIVIADDFHEQRNLNSVGTTMASINNETLLKILVPKLSPQEIEIYEEKHKVLLYTLSTLRRKIQKYKRIKNILLMKYF